MKTNVFGKAASKKMAASLAAELFLSRTPGIVVRVASMGAKSVSADGMTFSNLEDLSDVKTADVLLVPGGGGCLNAIEDDE